MKKVNWIILLGFVAALGFFTSCDETTDPLAPEIILSGDADVSVTTGDELTLNFSVSAGDENLTEVTIKKGDVVVYTGSEATEFDKDNMTVLYTETLNEAGTFVYTIEATDKGGLVTTKTVNVTVTGITQYTAKLLAAPLGDKSSNTFFKTASGATVAVTDFATNSAAIDFGYFYGSSKLSVLASPSDYLTTAYDIAALYPAATLNVTTFASTTGVVFEDVTTSAAIKAAYDNGTLATDGNSAGATRIGTLAVDDVVAFKTAGGKYGIIKVTGITGTDGADGSIEISVKIQ